MVEWPEPRWPYAPLLRLERRRLLDVLDPLGPDEWSLPTPCPGWTVLGLASHLVGDDLSFVAWQRDHHVGTPAPPGLDEPGFISWLDNLQVEWVDAARRMSPKLVVELLGWLDEQVAETVAGHDPRELAASVVWASATPVPRWLDHARELSERWIHRQQILEALGRPADLSADLAEPVLDALRWAYRYRLDSVRRPPGARVDVTVTGPQVVVPWSLTSVGAAWRFGAPADGRPIAELALTTDQAWRLLSNNLDVARHGRPVTSGDGEVLDVLLRTRAIIGMPR
jgi:uncharacterized protein (TIGR03083 family)